MYLNSQGQACLPRETAKWWIWELHRIRLDLKSKRKLRNGWLNAGGSGMFYAAKWKKWINLNSQRDEEIMILKIKRKTKNKKGKIFAGQTFGSTLSGSTTRLRGCPAWGTLLRAYSLQPRLFLFSFCGADRITHFCLGKISIRSLYDKLKLLTNKKRGNFQFSLGI